MIIKLCKRILETTYWFWAANSRGTRYVSSALGNMTKNSGERKRICLRRTHSAVSSNNITNSTVMEQVGFLSIHIFLYQRWLRWSGYIKNGRISKDVMYVDLATGHSSAFRFEDVCKRDLKFTIHRFKLLGTCQEPCLIGMDCEAESNESMLSVCLGDGTLHSTKLQDWSFTIWWLCVISGHSVRWEGFLPP